VNPRRSSVHSPYIIERGEQLLLCNPWPLGVRPTPNGNSAQQRAREQHARENASVSGSRAR
jgi:hypothetical protein